MTDEEAAALLRLALTSEPAREYQSTRRRFTYPTKQFTAVVTIAGFYYPIGDCR